MFERFKTIAEIEADLIRERIVETNGNLNYAARTLGIGRATLYRKIREYNLKGVLVSSRKTGKKNV